MNPKIGRTAFNAPKILKTIVSLSILLHRADIPSIAQTTTAQTAAAAQPSEIYAGIELTAEDVRAIALRVSGSEEEAGLELIYSGNIRLAWGPAGDGQFTPEAANEAAEAVLKLLARLRQQFQAPRERVFLIGAGLGADRAEQLVKAVSKSTGKSITFLDVKTEIQLSLVGTIPRLSKVDETVIDNRNSSALIEIDNSRTRGGYQLLKHPLYGANGPNSLNAPEAAPGYDFVTMNIPHGVAGETSFRQALRQEREIKPGLVNRKRVYLAGSVPWAVATLLYPENRQPFVQLTIEEIEAFAEKLTRAPQEIFNPNLSFIRDRESRRKARSELEAVKSAFTPELLAAGAEALRAVASEFEWREKQVWFARFGHLGCLLSYVRLRAER
jgi:hypothetical protein